MAKRTESRVSFIARLCLSISLLSFITAVLAGFGTRWELWDFRVGFRILSWGAYGAITALILSSIGIILTRPGKARKGFLRTVLAFLISLGLIGYLGEWSWTARHVPPIHDITTDTENPPRFMAILQLRQEALNPAEYGGPAIAAQQREGYPDLRPLTLSAAPDQAFNRALAAAREMGWVVVDANPAAGRIEATDTTFWFGFKDDIVVRISLEASGSRIDVRSVSRVGRSDVGTNAARIRRYLEKIRSKGQDY
jgi:uncharacterized protein (DUF1499 family)